MAEEKKKVSTAKEQETKPKKEAKKTETVKSEVKETKPKKIWTNDFRKLVSVEKTKSSIQFLDEKGELKGGNEFYGVPVE